MRGKNTKSGEQPPRDAWLPEDDQDLYRRSLWVVGSKPASLTKHEPVVELRFASDGVRCEVELNADAADALAEALQNRPIADTLEREVVNAE